MAGQSFPHQDGEGYNLVLQALPVDGRVVLRTPKEDDQPDGNDRRNRQGQGNNKPGNRRR